MTGVIAEYFLGIYFLVVSITFEGGRISADTVRLVAGVVLIILAILGVSFAK